MRTLTLAVLASGILTACSSLTQPPKVIHFICDNNSEISVEFGVDTALVTREDGKGFVLPQRISGSGFWYSSGRYDLRGKGNEVTWTDDTKPPRLCTAKPATEEPQKPRRPAV